MREWIGQAPVWAGLSFRRPPSKIVGCQPRQPSGERHQKQRLCQPREPPPERHQNQGRCSQPRAPPQQRHQKTVKGGGCQSRELPRERHQKQRGGVSQESPPHPQERHQKLRGVAYQKPVQYHSISIAKIIQQPPSRSGFSVGGAVVLVCALQACRAEPPPAPPRASRMNATSCFGTRWPPAKRFQEEERSHRCQDCCVWANVAASATRHRSVVVGGSQKRCLS